MRRRASAVFCVYVSVEQSPREVRESWSVDEDEVGWVKARGVAYLSFGDGKVKYTTDQSQE